MKASPDPVGSWSSTKEHTGFGGSLRPYPISFEVTTEEKGVDLAVVQRMLGHKQLATTVIYDRRGEKAKKEAAGVLSLQVDRRS
jgi:hypothetical protein